jgi:hypothetical protein
VDALKAELVRRAGEAAAQARPPGAAVTLHRARGRRLRRAGGVTLLTLVLAGVVVLADQRISPIEVEQRPVVPAERPAPVITPVTTTTTIPVPATTARPRVKAQPEGGTVTPGPAAGTGPAPTVTAPRVAPVRPDPIRAPQPPGAAPGLLPSEVTVTSGSRSGNRWRLNALDQGDAGSVCLSFQWTGLAVGPLGCRAGARLGATAVEGGSAPEAAIAGTAPATAVTVRVELTGRAPVVARTTGAGGLPGRFFTAFVPSSGAVRAVVALDGNGREIARTVPAGVVRGAPLP